MQSDMCNRSQDLITSVAVKTDSNEIFHTHAHLGAQQCNLMKTFNAKTAGRAVLPVLTLKQSFNITFSLINLYRKQSKSNRLWFYQGTFA